MFGEMYAVGHTYPKWATKDNLIQLNSDGSMWTLLIGYPGMTQEEMTVYSEGTPVHLAFTVIDSCLFLLFKFGISYWMDAPFEPRLYEDPLPYELNYDAGTGAPLLVLLVDTNSGKLFRMRTMGLSNLFSIMLHKECIALDQGVRPLGPDGEAAYHKRINSIYRKYPTPEAMLKTVAPLHMMSFVSDAHS